MIQLKELEYLFTTTEDAVCIDRRDGVNTDYLSSHYLPELKLPLTRYPRLERHPTELHPELREQHEEMVARRAELVRARHDDIRYGLQRACEEAHERAEATDGLALNVTHPFLQRTALFALNQLNFGFTHKHLQAAFDIDWRALLAWRITHKQSGALSEHYASLQTCSEDYDLLADTYGYVAEKSWDAVHYSERTLRNHQLWRAELRLSARPFPFEIEEFVRVNY